MCRIMPILFGLAFLVISFGGYGRLERLQKFSQKQEFPVNIEPWQHEILFHFTQQDNIRQSGTLYAFQFAFYLSMYQCPLTVRDGAPLGP